ncbi:MAG: hypothetical protein LBM00_11680 [Deltaproteobacteria bacterium]|jgi:predicted O-linked N-acetylglucosamine transferase (SPINDLY family)|nr:hypothetical protein [Deltaproteobacteria bacterium]
MLYGRNQLAARLYSRLNGKNRKISGQALFLEMSAWWIVCNWNRAFDTSGRLLRRDNECSEAALMLARSSAVVKRERQAADWLTEAENSFNIALAAVLLRDIGEYGRAAALLLGYIRRKPEYAELVGDYLLSKLNLRVEALEAYDLALAFHPSNALRLKRALTLPFPCLNAQTQNAALREISAELEELTQLLPDDSSFAQSFSFLYTQGRLCDRLFNVDYLGEKILPLIRNKAKASLHLFPDLYHNYLGSPRKFSATAKLRYGFFAETPTEHIHDFWGYILETLPRDTFEVILFIPKHLGGLLSNRLLGAADKVVEFPYYKRFRDVIPVTKTYGEKAFSATREIVAGETLDIFHNFLVSYDNMSLYLGFSRLAPVQITDGVRLTSSGMPETDYYLMKTGNFVDDPDEWFSEKLALIGGMEEFCFDKLGVRTNAWAKPPKRKDYNIPENKTFYLFSQDICRKRLETDVLIAKLFQRDPSAFIMVCDHTDYGYTNSLLPFENLKHNLESMGIKDIETRLQLMPVFFARPQHEYYAFLKLADANASLRYVNPGRVFWEHIHLSLPMIIYPGEGYYGYCAAGIYKKLGVDELLASNDDEYVEKTYKLAHDRKWKNFMAERIREGLRKNWKHGPQSAYRDISCFFQDAVKRARAGLPPAHWHKGRFYEQLTAGQLQAFAEAEYNAILSPRSFEQRLTAEASQD